MVLSDSRRNGEVGTRFLIRFVGSAERFDERDLRNNSVEVESIFVL